MPYELDELQIGDTILFEYDNEPLYGIVDEIKPSEKPQYEIAVDCVQDLNYKRIKVDGWNPPFYIDATAIEELNPDGVELC